MSLSSCPGIRIYGALQTRKPYLKTIKADGYATSSKYVDNTMRIVTQYDLQQYDVKGAGSMAKLASAVLAQARAWIGRNEADGTHKGIIDVYNGHKPLARGYKVKYTDACVPPLFLPWLSSAV